MLAHETQPAGGGEALGVALGPEPAGHDDVVAAVAGAVEQSPDELGRVLQVARP